MTKLSQDAQVVVGKAGLLLTSEERLNSPLATRRLIKILVTDHQAFTGDRPENVAATVEQLTQKLYNLNGALSTEVVKELRETVSGLLGLGRQSPVQKTLNGNGMRLCPTRVRKTLPDPNDPLTDYTRSYAARFVTTDGDLIYETLFETQVDQLKNAAARKGDLFRLIHETHPELGPRMQTRLNQLEGEMDKGLALPAPDQDTDDSPTAADAEDTSEDTNDDPDS